MTAEELALIKPADIARMSDEELARELAPLIPQARLAYARADELASAANTVLLPSGKRVTAGQLKKDNELMLQQLRRLGMK